MNKRLVAIAVVSLSVAAACAVLVVLTSATGWVDGDYIGIDEGSTIAMLENFRSDFVWRVMRRSPYLRRGLERAGFTGGWLDAAP